MIDQKTPVVVLAGGLGSRLRSRIAALPKPMAPVAGRPFLAYLIDYLRRQGLRRFIFSVCYRWEQIRDYFGDGAPQGVSIAYAVEEQPHGTGGAVMKAAGSLGEDVLVVNGDTYPLFSLTSALAVCSRPTECQALLFVARGQHAAAGSVLVGADGLVQRFAEKEAAAGNDPWCNCGIYYFRAQAFSLPVWAERCSLEYDVFPRLAALRMLGAVPTEGGFYDFGSAQTYDYLAAHPEILSAAGGET